MNAFCVLFLVSRTTSAAAMQPKSEHFGLTCFAFPPELGESDLIGRYGRENVTRAPVFGSDDGPQSPAERLELQQLLQLDFWSKRRAVDNPADEGPPTNGGRPSRAPESWELTRDIELHPWQRQCVDQRFAAGTCPPLVVGLTPGTEQPGRMGTACRVAFPPAVRCI